MPHKAGYMSGEAPAFVLGQTFLQVTNLHREKITRDKILDFISKLDVSDAIKEELNAISPFNYTGI